MGAATLFSATIGVVTYKATESIVLMIAVIMLTGIGCSLLNSVLASIFHIPVFVTTVAMMSVLSAVASQIITTKGGAVGGISIPSEVVKGLDTSGFKILVLVVWVLVCTFIFNYTKFGRCEKFVGGNPICAQLSGIKYNTYAILGFFLAGIGVGIGAFMTLVYTPSVTNNDCWRYRNEYYGSNRFLAVCRFLVVPSKIYAAVVGGFSYIVLNNIRIFCRVHFRDMGSHRSSVQYFSWWLYMSPV